MSTPTDLYRMFLSEQIQDDANRLSEKIAELTQLLSQPANPTTLQYHSPEYNSVIERYKQEIVKKNNILEISASEGLITTLLIQELRTAGFSVTDRVLTDCDVPHFCDVVYRIKF